MAGMPVYGIVSAHYEDSVVTKMVIGPFNSGEMLARVERNRDWLIEKLRDGMVSVCTVRKNQGRWEMIDDVYILNINGRKYLRIDRDSVPEDYLGEINKF